MENDPPLKIHQRMEGLGKTWLDEKLLGEVRYSLKEIEAVGSQLHSFSGTPTAAQGVRAVFGIFRGPAVRVVVQYVGIRLMLHLEDGRLMPFTVTKDLGQGSCLVQGLGEFV